MLYLSCYKRKTPEQVGVSDPGAWCNIHGGLLIALPGTVFRIKLSLERFGMLWFFLRFKNIWIYKNHDEECKHEFMNVFTYVFRLCPSGDSLYSDMCVPAFGIHNTFQGNDILPGLVVYSDESLFEPHFCPLQFVYIEAKHSHAGKESILFLSGGGRFFLGPATSCL